MPVGVVVTSYKTRTGRVRRIRLYECYWNMVGRTRGQKTARHKTYWLGKPIEFLNFQHFRTWAISAGYRKGVELDRIDSNKGYSPENCQFLIKSEHTRKSAERHGRDCRCVVCGWRALPKPLKSTECSF